MSAPEPTGDRWAELRVDLEDESPGEVTCIDGPTVRALLAERDELAEDSLDRRQVEVDQVTAELWPGETIEEAALALCEEAGEVARAVIKRNHAAAGTGDRAPQDWTAELWCELGQVVVVALKIAEREGLCMADAIEAEIDALRRRARRALGEETDR